MGTMTATTPNDTQFNKAAIRWSLTKPVLVAQTDRSWVYRVQRDDNRPAALYLFKAGNSEDARRAGRLLDWYRGDGALRHYGSSDDALLVEWADGRKLAEPALDGKDGQAMSALVNLIGMLHVPRPDMPEGLVPLREYLSDFFAADVRLWPDTARDLYARSVGIAYTTFDKPHAEIPLHGNVHHDRVLLTERGWVARAPIGLLGDPAYDLAASFMHPWSAVKLGADPIRINAMADLFSTKLGYRRKRILAFAAIHAADSACRTLERGQAINWQLAVLPNLLSVYDAA